MSVKFRASVKKDLRKVIREATMDSQVIIITLSVCVYP